MENTISRAPQMYREVFVWEMPVRVYHWVNALSIVILCITGFLIGDPVAFKFYSEASFGYWFGTVRFVHFVFAFLFFFNFVYRTYWGFVGNKYASWKNFIPYSKKHWNEIFDVLKTDIFQSRSKPVESIGHNNLAAFTYFLTFLAFALQALTGFGMYAAMSEAKFANLFAWFVPLIGGDLAARQVHHILMWVFIVFAMVHVYLVFYHDYIERRGTTSSMIGGWKFIEEEHMENLEKK